MCVAWRRFDCVDVCFFLSFILWLFARGENSFVFVCYHDTMYASVPFPLGSVHQTLIADVCVCVCVSVHPKGCVFFAPTDQQKSRTIVTLLPTPSFVCIHTHSLALTCSLSLPYSLQYPVETIASINGQIHSFIHSLIHQGKMACPHQISPTTNAMALLTIDSFCGKSGR